MWEDPLPAELPRGPIYSSWEKTKGFWLCLMTTLLFFSLLWLFSFVSAFLNSLIKIYLWLKFSTDKRQAEDMEVREGPKGPALFQRDMFSSICDPLDWSTPGFPILHHLPELVQIHVHWVSDAVQLSHPLSPPSPPALDLLQWVRSKYWSFRWPKYWNFSISPSN